MAVGGLTSSCALVDRPIKEVIEAEIKWRETKQKVAKLKGEDKTYKGYEKDIKKDKEKIEELNRKKEDLKNKD